MIVCVCTVGTGTAGKHSNLAQGLVNGLRLRQPRVAWLLPSTDENACAIADLVAEDLRTVDGITVQIPGHITSPDDLLRCRREIRLHLRAARRQYPRAVLVVNPTSGTKQMTAGAVLAALDVEAHMLDYITGDRADGVVRTGTERLSALNLQRIHAERAAREALRLFQHGALAGAAVLLAPHRDLVPCSHALLLALAAWQRFDYRGALQAVSQVSGPWLPPLRAALEQLAASPTPSLERAADMHNAAARTLDWRQAEEALAMLYRLVELCARLRLAELGVTPDTCTAECLINHPALNLPRRLAANLRSRQETLDPDQPLLLGLQTSLDVLETTGFALSVRIRRNTALWNTLQLRNQTRYGHGTEFVDPRLVGRLLDAVEDCARCEWPAFPQLKARFQFPDPNPIILQEVEYE